MFTCIRVFLGSAVLLWGSVYAVALANQHSEEWVQGQAKSVVCAACHGEEGNSPNPLWPKIAGQNPKYTVAQLKAFQKGKDGGRYDPSMTAMVANLSPKDMQALAVYYAHQTTQIGAADPTLVKRGERLYRGGDLKKGITACTACHAPTGAGNADAGFPKLSGQHAPYLVKTLQDYREGKRNSEHSASIMQSIAKRMDKKDMLAVASYIQGLH